MYLETEVNPIHIGMRLANNPEALADVLSAVAVNAPADLAKQVKEHIPDALNDRTSNFLEKLLIEILA